jgi:hypothetical protein
MIMGILMTLCCAVTRNNFAQPPHSQIREVLWSTYLAELSLGQRAHCTDRNAAIDEQRLACDVATGVGGE